MDKKARPSSVRLSGIFYLFNEVSTEIDSQQSLLEYKERKRSFFGFRQRSESENSSCKIKHSEEGEHRKSETFSREKKHSFLASIKRPRTAKFSIKSEKASREHGGYVANSKDEEETANGQNSLATNKNSELSQGFTDNMADESPNTAKGLDTLLISSKRTQSKEQFTEASGISNPIKNNDPSPKIEILDSKALNAPASHAPETKLRKCASGLESLVTSCLLFLQKIFYIIFTITIVLLYSVCLKVFAVLFVQPCKTCITVVKTKLLRQREKAGDNPNCSPEGQTNSKNSQTSQLAPSTTEPKTGEDFRRHDDCDASLNCEASLSWMRLRRPFENAKTFTMICVCFLASIFQLIVSLVNCVICFLARTFGCIVSCIVKIVIFVFSIAYIIVLFSVKLALLIARSFLVIVLGILSLPITIVTRLVYIFTVLSLVCKRACLFIKRKVKLYGWVNEKAHNIVYKEQETQGTPPLLKDVDEKQENNQYIIDDPRVSEQLLEDGLSPSPHPSFDHMREDIQQGTMPIEKLSLTKQMFRGPADFFEECVCYLFFCSLLLPISIAWFLKDPIDCFKYLYNIVVLHVSKTECTPNFSETYAVDKTIISDGQDCAAKSPGIVAKFVRQLSKKKDKSKRMGKTLSKIWQSEILPSTKSELELHSESEILIEGGPKFVKKSYLNLSLHNGNRYNCPCDPREYIGRLFTFLWILLHVLSVFVTTSYYRVTMATRIFLFNLAGACKVGISILVQLMPRKALKWFMIEMCHYLPDLRNRSLQLFIVKTTPSWLSKKIVMYYTRRVSLSLMYLHAQVSLKNSPSKKILQNLARLWKTAMTLLETIFLSISSVFKTASRIFKQTKRKKKDPVLHTKRASFIRLLSRET